MRRVNKHGSRWGTRAASSASQLILSSILGRKSFIFSPRVALQEAATEATGGDAISAQQHTYVATVAALAALLPLENVEGPELDSDEDALSALPPPPLLPPCLAAQGVRGGPRSSHVVCGPPTVVFTMNLEATDCRCFLEGESTRKDSGGEGDDGHVMESVCWTLHDVQKG